MSAMLTNALTNRRSGLILAADVETLDHLRALGELASDCPAVIGIKIGVSLALRYGLGPAVRALRDVCQLPAIYDHQKAGTDIPRAGEIFARACRESGVSALIIFPQAGPRTLEAFVKATFFVELVPIVGLVMTHPAYLVSEGGYISDAAPEEMCRTSIELGVRSFVLPGTKPEVVRRFAGGLLKDVRDVEIMMPGIGTQGGAIQSALAAAAPHVGQPIIGSAIYDSNTPKQVLSQFAEQL